MRFCINQYNIVRHLDMPKTVFKCLWNYIQDGKEIFAFVKNKTKQNDYYWVFTNVTASFDYKLLFSKKKT